MFGRLRCSFCGKDARDVLKLVAGPRVYICDQCVAMAAKIMATEKPAPEAAKSEPPNRRPDAQL